MGTKSHEARSAWFISRGVLDHECNATRELGIDTTSFTWDAIPFPPAACPAIARWMLDPAIDFAFQVSYMEELERRGARVINHPSSILLCDKESVYFLWARHLKEMIACPRTLATSNPRRALEFIGELDSAVIKPVQGQGGTGVVQACRDQPSLETKIRASLERHGALIIQERVPNHGWELRTIMIGNEIEAQFVRVGAGSTFKHGLGANGHVARVDEPGINVPASHLENARHVASMVKKITGLDLFALDTLVGTDGTHYLLEWNPFFGYGMVGGLGFNLASRVASYISRA
nr:hypothetical protein [Candidatus Sigynarchaeota archaeon]